MCKLKLLFIFMLPLLFILLSCAGGKTKDQFSAKPVIAYPIGDTATDADKGGNMKIYLAGGCFWGVEKYLALIPGVTATEVGYANGRTETPSYRDVIYHNTGHAETVMVEYDGDKLPLAFLLELFYEVIDPTSLNRQGNDVGTMYRTGIYYANEGDRETINASISRLAGRVPMPVVIEVMPLKNFYPAEEYHQNYLIKNPDGYCHIDPHKYEGVAASLERIMADSSKAAPAGDAAGLVNPENYTKPSMEEIREKLTEKQYMVTQLCDTEMPFSGEYNNNHRPGLYVDIVTGEPLFSSANKFDSGTGWPSFTKPINPAVIVENEDLSYGMRRVALNSRVGDSHLGHLFEDGPADRGGLRYCINSLSLRFIPYEEMESEGYGEFMPLCEVYGAK